MPAHLYTGIPVHRHTSITVYSRFRPPKLLPRTLAQLSWSRKARLETPWSAAGSPLGAIHATKRVKPEFRTPKTPFRPLLPPSEKNQKMQVHDENIAILATFSGVKRMILTQRNMTNTHKNLNIDSVKKSKTKT